MNRAAAMASAVVVLVVVITGLIISGSPGEQRQVRLDQQRINDLRSLSSQIDAYWQRQGELPTELASLIDGTRVSSISRDPNTGQAYESQYEEGSERAFWDHPAGRHCFSFTASGDRPGLPVPR
jgi:type II secretory pathway pseudopilin PulG